jgi:RNA polymerase-binding protein DksA
METPQIRLRRLRRESVRRLAALRAQIADVVDARRDSNVDDEHDPEGATLAFDRAQVAALADAAAVQLAEIDSALERLEKGTYATCERCGRPIGVARLEARPAARLCLECQAVVERKN